jgi:hypothetical protein
MLRVFNVSAELFMESRYKLISRKKKRPQLLNLLPRGPSHVTWSSKYELHQLYLQV